MADAMPYIGLRTASYTLWLSRPDGLTDYAVLDGAEFPAARVIPALETVRLAGGTLNLADPMTAAERRIPVNCLGTTGIAAEQSLHALRAALNASSCKLVWAAGEDRAEIWTTVRHWHVSEPTLNPLKREAGNTKKLRIDVTLVTDGPWTRSQGIAFSSAIAATPGVYDVEDVPGDQPALVDMVVTTDDARGALGVGLYHEPGSEYDPIDDYSGTVDAACFGGAKSAEYSIPASFHTSELIASAPSFDVAANAGAAFALARLYNTAAAAASVLYRALSTVSGSGSLGDSVSVPHLPVMAGAVSAFELVNLGEVFCPCAGMPGDDDVSGWDDEAVSESNTTAATLTALGDGYYQVFPEDACLHTGFTAKLKNTAAAAITVTARLYAASGGRPTGSVLAVGQTSVAAAHDGEVRFTWPSPGIEIGAGDYAVTLTAGTTGIEVYRDAAAGYAGGAGGSYAGGQWAPYAWGSSGVIASQGTQSDYYVTNDAGAYCGQTVNVAAVTLLETLTLYERADTSGTHDLVSYVSLHAASAGVPSGAALHAASAGAPTTSFGAVDHTFNYIAAAGDYAFKVYPQNIDQPGVAMSVQRNSSGGYAGGNAFDQDGADAGYDLKFSLTGRAGTATDLYFKSHSRAKLGFNAGLGVQVMTSESSKKARVDVVTRLPIDWWACLAYHSFGAAQGIRFQSYPSRPFEAFLCDTDGERGHSLKGEAVHRGTPGLWPGTNRLVFVGDHPGALDVSGTYWPRFSDAAAGEL